jgi:hypothetical protein
MSEEVIIRSVFELELVTFEIKTHKRERCCTGIGDILESERRRLCGLHGPRQHNCRGGKSSIRSHALSRFRAIPNQDHPLLKSLRRV